VNAVLNRVLRPKGRRRGPRQFLRITLADRGRRRKTAGIDELLGYNPTDPRSFL
jgi:hypothetical protein